MENLGAVLQAQDRVNSYKTNHILHLIISFFFLGLWIPVWILVTISNANARSGAKKQLMKAAYSKSNEKYTEPINWNGIFWTSFILGCFFIVFSIGKI